MSSLKIGDRVVWRRHQAGKEKPEFFDATIVKFNPPTVLGNSTVQIKVYFPGRGEILRSVKPRNLRLREVVESSPNAPAWWSDGFFGLPETLDF